MLKGPFDKTKHKIDDEIRRIIYTNESHRIMEDRLLLFPIAKESVTKTSHEN